MRYSKLEPIFMGESISIDAQFPSLEPTIVNLLVTGQYRADQLLIIDRAAILYEIFKQGLRLAEFVPFSIREHLRQYLNSVLTYAREVSEEKTEYTLSLILRGTQPIVKHLNTITKIDAITLEDVMSWFDVFEDKTIQQESTSNSSASIQAIPECLASPLDAQIFTRISVFPQISGLSTLLFPTKSANLLMAAKKLITGLKAIISAKNASYTSKPESDQCEFPILKFQKPVEYLKIASVFVRSHYLLYNEFKEVSFKKLKNPMVILPGQKTTFTINTKEGTKTIEKQTSTVVDSESHMARKTIQDKLSEGSESQKQRQNTTNQYENIANTLNANVGGGYGPIHASVSGGITQGQGKTNAMNTMDSDTSRKLSESTAESVNESNTAREMTVSLGSEKLSEMETTTGFKIEYVNPNRDKAISFNGHQTASLYNGYILLTNRELFFSNGLESVEVPITESTTFIEFIDPKYRTHFQNILKAPVKDVEGNEYAPGEFRNRSKIKDKIPFGIPIHAQPYEVLEDVIVPNPYLMQAVLLSDFEKEDIQINRNEKIKRIDELDAKVGNIRLGPVKIKTEWGLANLIVAQSEDGDKITKSYLMSTFQVKQPTAHQIIDKDTNGQ